MTRALAAVPGSAGGGAGQDQVRHDLRHDGPVVLVEEFDAGAHHSPVEWTGRTVTIRASRSGDALTVRARVDAEPWRLVRVAPLAPDAAASAGPFCCAPSRADLTVHFTSWTTSAADESLHPED